MVFWIADKLKSENIKVEYCPTEHMIGDFFTKPLGGSLFITMRDICQGLIPLSELKIRHKYKIETNKESEVQKDQDYNVLKERVGNVLSNHKNFTDTSLNLEEREESSNKEPNKNESSGINSRTMQGYMNVNSSKPRNNEEVILKCDKDMKVRAECQNAGKTNFTCHGENIVRNHGVLSTTINSIKENENKNTNTRRSVINTSASHLSYAEAAKKGLNEK